MRVTKVFKTNTCPVKVLLPSFRRYLDSLLYKQLAPAEYIYSSQFKIDCKSHFKALPLRLFIVKYAVRCLLAKSTVYAASIRIVSCWWLIYSN